MQGAGVRSLIGELDPACVLQLRVHMLQRRAQTPQLRLSTAKQTNKKTSKKNKVQCCAHHPKTEDTYPLDCEQVSSAASSFLGLWFLVFVSNLRHWPSERLTLNPQRRIHRYSNLLCLQYYTQKLLVSVYLFFPMKPYRYYHWENKIKQDQ